MKKTLLMGLALIAFAHASAGDKTPEKAPDKGAFGRSLDDMQPSSLNDKTAEKRAEFRANPPRERTGYPYKKGYGAYKGKVDKWAERGESLADVDPLAVPMRMRPVARKEVVDMFRVTEEQLMANPSKAHQFYAELQDTKKSGSYKEQRSTKATADKWISWLEAKGFGGTTAAAPATGPRVDARGRDEAREEIVPQVRSTRAERRRLEADRRDMEDRIAAVKAKHNVEQK